MAGALVIGIKPKDDGGPPPMSPLDGAGPGKSQGPDHSSEYCHNCESYEPAQMVCMRFPEWHPHDPQDWCREWTPGEPRTLGGGQAEPDQDDVPQGQPAPQPAMTR